MMSDRHVLIGMGFVIALLAALDALTVPSPLGLLGDALQGVVGLAIVSKGIAYGGDDYL